MRRQGGGFGFVVLLVVLAVIFFIAMNNFKSVAPEAMAIKRHNASRQAGQRVNAEDGEPAKSSPSASSDAWTPAPPSRPNLDAMDQKTTQHTEAVSDALSQGN